MRTVKLTREMLKRIVNEEASKFGDMTTTADAAKETEEVDADEQADSLEKQIDYMNALKIEEHRLVVRLAKIKETKRSLLKKIAGK